MANALLEPWLVHPCSTYMEIPRFGDEADHSEVWFDPVKTKCGIYFRDQARREAEPPWLRHLARGGSPGPQKQRLGSSSSDTSSTEEPEAEALLAEAVEVSINGVGALVETENGQASPRAGHRDDMLLESIVVEGVTTLMVRNLPHNIVQGDLVRELDKSGFRDTYDFLYMPCVFHSGRGKGYAFVNFVCPSIACTFMSSWHKSHRFLMAKYKKTLDISVACIQGHATNVLKWDDSKRRRVLNPNYRPIIRPGLVPQPARGAACPVLDAVRHITPLAQGLEEDCYHGGAR